MLVVKVYVNTNQIDEVWIHNLGKGDSPAHYEIVKPVGYNDVIKHQRDEGYEPLLAKVMTVLGNKRLRHRKG